MKIIKCLEVSGLLIKSVIETVENEVLFFQEIIFLK